MICSAAAACSWRLQAGRDVDGGERECGERDHEQQAEGEGLTEDPHDQRREAGHDAMDPRSRVWWRESTPSPRRSESATAAGRDGHKRGGRRLPQGKQTPTVG